MKNKRKNKVENGEMNNHLQLTNSENISCVSIPQLTLNQAPNIALDCIRSHRRLRRFCAFWATLFCIPTMGFTYDNCCAGGGDYCGCFARRTSDGHSKLMYLEESIDILKSDFPEEDQKQQIEQQVCSTIALLEGALLEECIGTNGYYVDPIYKAYDIIYERALADGILQQEEYIKMEKPKRFKYDPPTFISTEKQIRELGRRFSPE